MSGEFNFIDPFGPLPAGSYDFIASGNVEAGVSWKFSTVPEPGTGLLLVAGLLGLGAKALIATSEDC